MLSMYTGRWGFGKRSAKEIIFLLHFFFKPLNRGGFFCTSFSSPSSGGAWKRSAKEVLPSGFFCTSFSSPSPGGLGKEVQKKHCPNSNENLTFVGGPGVGRSCQAQGEGEDAVW